MVEKRENILISVQTLEDMEKYLTLAVAEKKVEVAAAAAARFGIISQITNLMILFLMEGRDTMLPCSSKHLINLMPVVAPYSKPTRFMAFMLKFQ